MANELAVLIYPHKTLREKAKIIESFDKELASLATNMSETMYRYRGIGLAANQVDVLKQIFVLDVNWRDEDEDRKKVPKSPEYYVNPEILSREGEIEYEEGCLSIPKMYGLVKRSEIIEVKFQDLKGKEHRATLTGLRAIAFQHELDHLAGIMFFDHLSPFKRRTLLEKFNKLQLELLQEKKSKED